METSNMSYMHKIGKYPLRAITLGTLLENIANKYPKREAFVFLEQNQRLTYQELLEKADKCAAGLAILGLKKGDRLGLWATNIAEWLIVTMACVRAGIVMVAMSPQTKATEIEYLINKVGAKMIICPHRSKYQNFYDVLTEVAPELKHSQPGQLQSQKIPTLKGVIVISEEELNGTYNFDKLMKLADSKSTMTIKDNQHLIKPDDPCYILFSSGTTGLPKAAVATHFHVVNNSFNVGIRNELDQKHHIICCQVPFFHAFGTTFAIAGALNFGSTVIVPWSTYNRLENFKALKQENCSMIYGTPTMYVDLINMQKQLHLKIEPEIAVIGAAPCSSELLRKMKVILNLKRVKLSYGMTEIGTIAFQSLPIEEDEIKVTTTVGHVSDHFEIKVVDTNDNIVPYGIRGELFVRGYCIMLGYWDDEEKTNEMIFPDRWLRTGDQFILQEDGYGKIVGRIKDNIIRGGEKIYPKEIEDILNTHPDIIEVYVIGISHERLGEEVCACIKLRNGSKLLTQEDLYKYFKEKISFYKIPSKLLIVHEFPKTASGKIRTQELRKLFVTE